MTERKTFIRHDIGLDTGEGWLYRAILADRPAIYREGYDKAEADRKRESKNGSRRRLRAKWKAAGLSDGRGGKSNSPFKRGLFGKALGEDA